MCLVKFIYFLNTHNTYTKYILLYKEETFKEKDLVVIIFQKD